MDDYSVRTDRLYDLAAAIERGHKDEAFYQLRLLFPKKQEVIEQGRFGPESRT